MGSRKLVRDLLLSNRLLHLQLHSQQVVKTRLPLISGNRVSIVRQFSVLDEISKKIKGEVESNPELQKSIKDLKEKAGELKGVKEELKVRTKQTTEHLYKRVDGAWTEAEAAAKKVSANVKEKISSATEEVKETLGLGKQEASSSTSTSTKTSEGHVKDGGQSTKTSEGHVKDGGPTSGEEKSETSKSSDTDGSLFGRFKSIVSSATPIISSATTKLKDIKLIEQTKKAYEMAKEELSSNPSKRRRMQYEASSSSAGERSKRTDVVVVPIKQSVWSKKWEAFKDKMNAHPVTKKIRGISEPVVTKGQEIVEDVREHWETSDHPVVHKIQDINDTVFGESDTALTYKEIRSRDPHFSLPDFVAEVEEMIKPTVNALLKCDVETLKKNCAPQLIERCLAERRAYESQGLFFDNKLLHVSEAEVREVKLMGNTPIIFVNFRTQQLFRVRNKEGVITEGGQDTIHTIYYVWAMQLLDADEQGEGALYPTWRIREVQQVGIRALI